MQKSADWPHQIYRTPNTTEDPDGFYSSNMFADTLLKFIKETALDRAEHQKPFFAYLPFSAPHQPIQCFQTDRDNYKGVYDLGPDHLRSKRLAKMAEMGFIDPDVEPHPVLARSKEWGEMSSEEQRLSARNYECYAGMVEALDRATGRVIDYLRQSGELDNTIVLAFSDNGPEGGGAAGPQVPGLSHGRSVSSVDESRTQLPITHLQNYLISWAQTFQRTSESILTTVTKIREHITRFPARGRGKTDFLMTSASGLTPRVDGRRHQPLQTDCSSTSQRKEAYEFRWCFDTHVSRLIIHPVL